MDGPLETLGVDPLADRHGRARPPPHHRSLTGREVARLVRAGSQPAVNAVLRRLAEECVVGAEEAGSPTSTRSIASISQPTARAISRGPLGARAATFAPRLPSGRSDPHTPRSSAPPPAATAMPEATSTPSSSVLHACPRTTRAGGRSWSGLIGKSDNRPLGWPSASEPAFAAMRQIQELPGHKHLGSTQRYTRVNAHELRGAIKRLRWVG